MGLLDILRGQRTPPRPNLDGLFAISTAEATLVVNLGLMPMGRSGVCFKPVQMAAFATVMGEVEQLLNLEASGGPGGRVRRLDDSLGFSWMLLQAPTLPELTVGTHAVNRALEDGGFAAQLLCSVFGFHAPDGPVLLVYGYKRGRFYPFVPRGDRERDTAAELRLQASLARELPMESDRERWYPVWGAPVLDGASPDH